MNKQAEFRQRYEFAQNWQEWPETVLNSKDIKETQKLVSIYREKNSHKGIQNYKVIEKLNAKNVNQAFLNEIGELTNLTHLRIEILTAEDLSPIKNLTKLKFWHQKAK